MVSLIVYNDTSTGRPTRSSSKKYPMHEIQLEPYFYWEERTTFCMQRYAFLSSHTSLEAKQTRILTSRSLFLACQTIPHIARCSKRVVVRSRSSPRTSPNDRNSWIRSHQELACWPLDDTTYLLTHAPHWAILIVILTTDMTFVRRSLP